MADKPNRHCPVCGVHYHVCKSCGDRGTWRSICDTPTHYQVYMTTVQYVRKEINKETAMEYLRNIGVSLESADRFTPNTKAIITEILSEEATAKKTTRRRKAVKHTE